MGGGLFFLIFILFALLMGGLVIYGYIQNKKRQEALQVLAQSHGWTFSNPGNQGWMTAFDGSPFNVGHSRRVDALITGASSNGKNFALFDYRYQETVSDGKETHEETYYFHILACQTALPGVPLFLSREHSITRMWDAISGQDIDFEDEEFNRAYRVRCADRKFANDVLTPRTMEAYKAWPYGGAFSYQNGYIVWYHQGTWDPTQVEALVNSLSWFTTALPNFLFEPDK